MTLNDEQKKVLNYALRMFTDTTNDCITEYKRSGLPAHKPEIEEMLRELEVVDEINKVTGLHP